MSKKKSEKKGRIFAKLDLSSTFWRTFLMVLAAFLTFIGPTYIVYMFINILKINRFVSTVSGFVLFMTGLLLIWYLIRNKIVS